MGFYDLSKNERLKLTSEIYNKIDQDISTQQYEFINLYFSDEDTYIRKAAYLAIGKLFYSEVKLQEKIFTALQRLLVSKSEKIRQTTVNAAGEIGKFHFKKVQYIFDKALFDDHHSVRNAVIGSVKKMADKNPEHVLPWAKTYLHHPDKEIRREICHGIELRGRKYPQDILPLLQELEFDTEKRVSKTLVHVLGQISYKKGCLPIVISHLNKWKNKELVTLALDEVIDVHERYKKFSSRRASVGGREKGR